jgi:glycosyltransferase involved in cell wall biosynthesis/2-polyprenyl-3-methyl-5-hydroxy-6-metoxy-1,4-benzoquinol methylase
MIAMQIPQLQKYRIAIWTPLPPLKTGIADYLAELLPYLVENFDLEIFVDDSYNVADDLLRSFKIFPYQQYAEREQIHPFDLNIYQMGNNEYHSYIYEQALKIPGLVVLHDLSLSFMLYHLYAGLRNDLASFRNELLFSEGADALKKFNRFYNSGDNEAIMDFFSDHHMLRRLVGRNYAMLSHLDYSAEVARQKYGAKHAYSMYLGSPDPTLEVPGISKREARQQLNISDDQFVVGIFGHLQPNKQNDVMLRALARIKAGHPRALVVFVGEVNRSLNYDQYIKDLIQKHNLGEHVRLTGFVSRKDMQMYYLASDVIVNLRYPSFGQMSATLSRGIATGRPAIITDLPEWRFFPENFCWHVPAEDTEGKELARLVVRLMENPAELDQRGQAARDFYLQTGTSQKAAENLQKIVCDIIENIPKQVTLEEQPVITASRSEIVNTAFEEWDRLRAGGKFRYKIEKIRRVPLIGPLLFAAFVFFANLIQAREIRRAEWSLNKTFLDGISGIEAKNKTASDEIAKLAEETRSEYMPASVRVLDDPLGSIAGYQSRKPGQGKAEDTDEIFYNALEQAFRGSEEIVRKRQLSALDEIKSYGKLEIGDSILDVGCGRGEFLSLLQGMGVRPIGVDANRVIVRELQEKGFEAYAQDIFEYLSSVPDGTFKGITAFHVIEHLTHDQNMAFLSLANKKLAVGGFIYLETPNPLCLESLSRFYTDPTHQRPIQPFQLSFLLEYNYFKKLKLLFLEPIRTRGTLSSERWITLYQDYGVLASKV